MGSEFIIAGWMDYGTNRDAVLGHFAECAVHSRAEPGCLDYVVCADPEHSGRIVIFERWTSEPDLAEHFTTAHIAAFRSAIAPFERQGKSMHRFFVSRSEEFESPRVASTG